MANIEGRFKFQLLFNLLPSADKVERNDQQERKEYKDFLEVEKSAELQEYYALEKEVNQKEFQQRIENIKKEQYAGSDAWKKEKAYTQLKKSKPFKKYFLFKVSDDLAFYEKFMQSAEHKAFLDLHQVVESADFQSKLNNKDEHAISRMADWKRLQTSDAEKRLSKISSSSNLANFKAIHGSEKLREYESLEKYLNSVDFQNVKADLLNKDRYKQSPEFIRLSRFRELSEQPALKKYLKDKAVNRFKEVSQWEVLFFDDFGKNLHPEKWGSGYYWGNVGKLNYSLASDMHFFSEKKNFEFGTSGIVLHTRKEISKGKAWDPKKGFFEKEFSYTSAMINSGAQYSGNNGRIEAKIRFSGNEDVFHAFWLVASRMVPHINIARVAGNRIWFENIWAQDPQQSERASIGASRFRDKFFIISLDWEANSLKWMINGVPVLQMSQKIPTVPLYLNVSSGVEPKEQIQEGNGSLNISWIRWSAKKT